MNKEELSEYTKLLKRATGFFRRDVEGKFQFAAALREMVRLSGSSLIVSSDLGMSGASEVDKYIAIVEFWGDDRIPDFPGQPARWGHYRDVLFCSEFSGPGRRNQAYLAAMRGGIHEVDRVRKRFIAEDRERFKKSPEALRNAEAAKRVMAGMWVGSLISHLDLAARIADRDEGYDRAPSPEEAEAILAAFEEVTRRLSEIGVIPVLRGKVA